ncbi:unnamed protein product [Adineta ricciae]|uniref:Uncharacterized protein n=1 Tax=Adineta ricciae TaxID=249248 RepID=A0A815LK49_ADIRI|nr:unnamed protein product [Adineta ricciae]
MITTSKLEQLIVKKIENYQYGFIDGLLVPLSIGNSLKYLHLIFSVNCSGSDYMYFVNRLIKRQISFHTMIFEIERDCHNENNNNGSRYPNWKIFIGHLLYN